MKRYQKELKKMKSKIFFLLAFILLFIPSLVNSNSDDVAIRLANLEKRITELETYIEMGSINYTHQKVTVTAYHPNSKGINSDRNPARTATMKRPIAGYTLAISNELFRLGWLNKKIYIDGWGVGRATDRMSTSVKGKHIDICFPSLKTARTFGIKRGILAVLLLQ